MMFESVKEENKKTLAICVPTYGRASVIGELLTQKLSLYAKYGIDLYIYDSNEDDETEEFVKSFQAGSDNLYYVRLPSDMHSNMKVYEIYQRYGWVKDYDYVWMCQDALRYSEPAVSRIMDNITSAGYDIFVTFVARSKADECEREYTDKNSFFVDSAWKLTLYGGCVLNTRTMLEGVRWDYLTGKYGVPDKINFSHICFYYEHILTLDNFKAKNIYIEPHWLTVSKLRSHSGWRESVFSVWLVYCVSAINALPDFYRNKVRAIKNFGLYGGVFSARSLIGMRKDGILNTDVYKQYKKRWIKYSGKSIVTFFLCARAPEMLLDSYATGNLNLIARFFTLIRLKKFCKKYDIIYMYGAGTVAKRYIGYLSKMNITLRGLVVTDINQQAQSDINGIPIISFDMINTKERCGLILGLNKNNASVAKRYIAEKHFGGGVFDKYIR